MNVHAAAPTIDRPGVVEDLRRVLIVDDERDFAFSLQDILESRGYIVALAHSAREALAVCDEFDAHVALVDIRLGRTTGIELVSELAPQRPALMFIMMTAYAETETAIRALHHGAFGYLRKPFDADELLHTIDRCFERLRLEREKREAEAARLRANEELARANLELRQVNDQLHRVVEIASALQLCTREDELLDRLLHGSVDLLGAQSGRLDVIGPAGLDRVAVVGAATGSGHQPFPLAAGALQADALASLGIVRRPAPATPDGPPAGLAFPVLDDAGRPLALLSVYRTGPGDFGPGDGEIGAILAACGSKSLSLLRAQQTLAERDVQLQSSKRLEAVGRLAGGVAHDFNNLLTPILGYAEKLLAGLGTEDPAQRPLSNIVTAGERARDLTRQLLAFGRKQLLELRTVNLSDVVAGLRDVLRRTLQDDVELRLELADDGDRVRCDVAQIEQALVTLTLSAQDSMPDGGTLWVTVDGVELDAAFTETHGGCAPGPYVRLAVRDTGHGLDPELLDHVFEPFFTMQAPFSGRGFGLASVYGTIRQHEGCARVTSATGKGTTVELFLPQAADG